jgi:hypothetical protein
MLTLAEWGPRYAELHAAGLIEAPWGGPLQRHRDAGDTRLDRLRFDDSAAALALWNLLLTEEDRLRAAKADGELIVGTMKDLGTVPVMVYGLPRARAFYPDGAWWLPCVQQLGGGQLAAADALGASERLCPVRALLGSFALGSDFPEPDLLICAVGATCDDLSAVAQRLVGLGRAIHWWNLPHRRAAEPGESVEPLPGGGHAPARLVRHVERELALINDLLTQRAGCAPDLPGAITHANAVRSRLLRLRGLNAGARAPLPALELQVAEMLAVHYCSDRSATVAVLDGLVRTCEQRIAVGHDAIDADAVRVYWVNPVADLAAMNLIEELGGRLVGSEFMFPHAVDLLPTDVPPLTALARAALADPMVGSADERLTRIALDATTVGAEVVVLARIPGASHCPGESIALGQLPGLPVIEVEIPPLIDGVRPALTTRLQAAFEIARSRRC